MRGRGRLRAGEQLLVLSAKTPGARSGHASAARPPRGATRSRTWPTSPTRCSVGRRAFAHRRAVVVRDRRGRARPPSRDPARLEQARRLAARSVVFLFPGQGAQYVGMGRGLYESEASSARRRRVRGSPRARPSASIFARCSIHGGRTRAAPRSGWTRPALTQPALFVIEYALARLWMSLGREAGGDDRPQPGRVRGRLPGRRLHA